MNTETMQWAGKTWIVKERAGKGVLVRDTDGCGNQHLWLVPEVKLNGQQGWMPDYRSWQPFFIKRVVVHMRSPERPLNPKYVRHKEPPQEGDACGHYITSFPRYPQGDPVHINRLRMDKYACFRYMRQRAIERRSYLGQTYKMFVGPVGFLP